MRCRLLLMCVGAVALVGCTSSESSSSLQPATTAATSSPATTTSTTSTTVASSTTVAPTTVPTVPGGWTPLDRDSVAAFTSFPCCASNWYGAASPALPTPGSPLPRNGSFHVDTAWGGDVTAPLGLVLHRFAPCGALPVGACEDEGGTWSADSMGVDTSASYTLTVPLDDHLRVVLTGFAGFTDTGAVAAFAEGNGHDLAALAQAVETAHAEVIMPKYASGMTPDQIVATVSAAPEGGFVAGLDESEYSLSFIHGDAPPLLFQSPVGYDDPAASRGTDVLQMPSIEMIDGILTLYVYAGFYS